MPVFIVAYDLNRTGQNYPDLIKQLQSVQHCKPQKSLWLIDSPLTEAGVRDVLRRHIDSNDTILVSEVSKTWAGFNMPDCGRWLNGKGY